MVKKFRAASGTGKISFVDAGGHDVSAPLSFNGFSQTLDGLLNELSDQFQVNACDDDARPPATVGKWRRLGDIA
jgi:hypothetical protein